MDKSATKIGRRKQPLFFRAHLHLSSPVIGTSKPPSLFSQRLLRRRAMNSSIWLRSLRTAAPVLVGAAGISEAVRYPTRTEEATATVISSLADLSPYPPIRVFRPNDNLEIAFDVRTRNPVYVLERLVVVGGSNRHGRPNFFEERDMPTVYRSQLQHYHKSGYDRGHMAPAADFLYSKSAYNDTFTLCNVSPQDPVLNKKDWANLEEWTRAIAKKALKEHGAITYVMSGPMWLPKRQIGEKMFQYVYPALGKPPSLVGVPTHFFKVVAVVKNGKIIQFACFVMANAEPQPNRDLQDYLVRWSDLEAVTGLQFFPLLVDEAWKQKADQLTGSFLKQAPQVLLLTDGGKSSSSSTREQKGPVIAQHLCDRSACRRS